MITREIKPNEELYLAFTGREMVLRDDGGTLDYNDMLKLQAAITYDMAFTEEETCVSVLGLQPKDAGDKGCCQSLPQGYELRAIRLYNAEQDEETVMRISRAKGLLEWMRNTKYCSCCGAPLHTHATQTAMVCSNCGKLTFPRIEPCIIVLVRNGDKMLLARHVQRNQDIYACIAGFMETGETAEQAVQREIMEETGLKVKNIRYFGSQSWPFPSQLMLAFTADYAEGEIKIQESEIQHAAWFNKDECPATPQPGSIAYRLIHGV